ncbi:hypothetical protein ES703_07538 [subsurface metagenome]
MGSGLKPVLFSNKSSHSSFVYFHCSLAGGNPFSPSVIAGGLAKASLYPSNIASTSASVRSSPKSARIFFAISGVILASGDTPTASGLVICSGATGGFSTSILRLFISLKAATHSGDAGFAERNFSLSSLSDNASISGLGATSSGRGCSFTGGSAIFGPSASSIVIPIRAATGSLGKPPL